MADERSRAHDGPDGMTPIDSPARDEADRWADSPISYGQSVTSDDPEVAAGSDETRAEQRIERAEGEGQPLYIPPQPDPTRNADREQATRREGR